MDSRDVEIAIIKRKMSAVTSSEQYAVLEAELSSALALRKDTALKFYKVCPTSHCFVLILLFCLFLCMTLRVQIASLVAGERGAGMHMSRRLSVRDYTCSSDAIEAFHAHCLNMGQHAWALKHAMSFVSMCDAGHSARDIVAAVKQVCPYLQTHVVA